MTDAATGPATDAATDPGTDPVETSARRELVATARCLAAAGLSPGSSGNLSVRVGDRVLMTPTGSSLSRVAEDDLAIVELDSARAQPGPVPSKELPLHIVAYRVRPQIRAVVHLHAPHSTALSCLPPVDGRAALPAYTPYGVMRLDGLRVASYARPGSDALGESIRDPLAEHDAVLLAGHGSVTVGASLAAAADLAEELESAAQLVFLLGGGDRRAVTLPDDEVRALRDRARRPKESR